MKKYTEEYAIWLENALIKSLTKNKQMSDKELKTKIKNANIEYVDNFVTYLLNTNEENKIRSTIEFLDIFPISLQLDGYDDDEVWEVNRWEIGVIKELVFRLNKEHEYITRKVYVDFFEKVIENYKPYFLDETYEKILPENVFTYWVYRIDKNIPWCEIANHPENIAVDLIAMIENQYLDIDKSMYDYEYLKNNTDC